MDKTELKYLSLRTAAGLYGYTRDHLGLMIRSGKLQGIKLGSYYVTTNEWMSKYIKKFANPNHPTLKNKLSNKFLFKALSLSKEEGTFKKLLKTGGNIKNKNLNGKNFFLPPKDGLEENSSIDLQEKLSKELNNLVAADAKILGASGSESGNGENTESKMFLDYPYAILPIRKMSDNEMEEILKRTKKNIQ